MVYSQKLAANLQAETTSAPLNRKFTMVFVARILLVLLLSVTGAFAFDLLSERQSTRSVIGDLSKITKTERFIASNNGTSCTPETKSGTTSIILVHGLDGASSSWDQASDTKSISMWDLLDKIPQITRYAFGYEASNQSWVTNPNIGPALAKKIRCEASVSKNGKVILLGHSMGGLAIKYALGQPEIAKHVDLVITLVTPYRGSGLGSVADAATRSFCRLHKHQSCQPYAYEGLSSIDLNLVFQLPSWPAHVKVVALASEVFLAPGISTGGDMIVSKTSAMAGAHIAKPKLFKCLLFQLPPKPCDHGNIYRYAPVQAEVMKRIAEYLGIRPVVYKELGLWLSTKWKVTSRENNEVYLADQSTCKQPNRCAADEQYSTITLNSPSEWDFTLETRPSVCDDGKEVSRSETSVELAGEKVQVLRYRCTSMPGRQFDVWWVPSKGIQLQAWTKNGLQAEIKGAWWR